MFKSRFQAALLADSYHISLVPQRKYPDAALANLDRSFMVNMPQRGCIEPMALAQRNERGGARPRSTADAARARRRGDRIAVLLLRCVRALLAQSGHSEMSAICRLSGVKQT
jgi:hypothetical protein